MMNAKHLLYAVVLVLTVTVGSLANLLVVDTPPPSPALTTADVEEYRASLQGLIKSPPNVTNANVTPHSANQESRVAG